MRNVYAFNIDLKQRNRVIAVVMIGAFVGVLNQTLMTTILPEIMKDFTVSSSTAQWLTTIFMLVNGIMIPITAFLIERFTLRSLFFNATCFLMIGSFICMLGINFPMLLVGRSIQALGAGILMPLTQTLLFIMFPPEKRGMAMGMFGLVIGFAPAIGPTAAGWFVNIFDWRYLFLVVLLIGMVDFVFGYLSLPNITELSKPNLDKLSVIISTVSFGGLLYGFSTAGNLGWSHPMVYITIIVAIVILTVFIFRQLKLESPLLEFRVFKYNDFSVAMILIV
ncbi:DHA2 family efflux MFS transporter permease subunit, partial [Staphylococcus aureus]